jgi:hypothetical protein
MNFSRALFCGLAALLGSAACSHYVSVRNPPVIDLRTYNAVAVLEFPVLGLAHKSPQEVTRRYLAMLYGAQPGVKVLEIGDELQVLAELGLRKLDPEAIRLIGQKYGVDAVLTGEMSVTEMTPSVSVGQNLTSFHASAKVQGELNAKVRETAVGATAWANGAHGTWTLGGFSVNEKGLTNVGVSDIDAKYEAMLADLLNVATQDFRPTYSRQKVD